MIDREISAFTILPKYNHILVNPRNAKFQIDLKSYESFMGSQPLQALAKRYETDSVTAKHAVQMLTDDLTRLNANFTSEKSRTLFTTLQGRVKSSHSFFRKLYSICQENTRTQGFDKSNLDTWYDGIHDMAGVRFSCPYFDEVEFAVNEQIRPFLVALGYGIDLSSVGLLDKNYLDKGDDNGYRSYHLFLKVPTPIDIYGNTKIIICEVQGRSELQHVWAVKSHDLLYKPEQGWLKPSPETIRDMQELSNSLRAVDHFLCKIRKHVRGT